MAAVPPPIAAPAPTRAGSLAEWLLPLVLGLALLLTLGLLTAVLARRSRTKKTEPAVVDDDLELHGRLAEREPAPPVEAEDVSVDTAVFHLEAGSLLEKTRVLSGQGLLWMRRPGEDPRSFVLPRDKAFAIGRDPETNTLAIPDPALSTHHFKIVCEGDEHYLVDLHSTNGSFVNGERVLVRKLRNGDVIHAGQVELDFRSLGRAAG